MTATTLVLFDDECPMCRFLAELAARRSAGRLAFRSWQDYRVSDDARAALAPAELDAPADRLRVLTEGRLLHGEAAWEAILELHPDMKGLEWLSARLGLIKVTARALDVTGHVARRICRRCGSR